MASIFNAPYHTTYPMLCASSAPLLRLNTLYLASHPTNFNLYLPYFSHFDCYAAQATSIALRNPEAIIATDPYLSPSKQHQTSCASGRADL
jgi:hypothetical protein